MKIEDIDAVLARMIPSEKDEEIKGMIRNAKKLCRRKEYVAAYWILQAFTLGHTLRDDKAEVVLQKIIPIMDALYAGV